MSLVYSLQRRRKRTKTTNEEWRTTLPQSFIEKLQTIRYRNRETLLLRASNPRLHHKWLQCTTLLHLACPLHSPGCSLQLPLQSTNSGGIRGITPLLPQVPLLQTQGLDKLLTQNTRGIAPLALMPQPHSCGIRWQNKHPLMWRRQLKRFGGLSKVPTTLGQFSEAPPNTSALAAGLCKSQFLAMGNIRTHPRFSLLSTRRHTRSEPFLPLLLWHLLSRCL